MTWLARSTGIKSGPERSVALLSSTTSQPAVQALYISEMLPSYPRDEVSEQASLPGTKS